MLALKISIQNCAFCLASNIKLLWNSWQTQSLIRSRTLLLFILKGKERDTFVFISVSIFKQLCTNAFFTCHLNETTTAFPFQLVFLSPRLEDTGKITFWLRSDLKVIQCSKKSNDNSILHFIKNSVETWFEQERFITVPKIYHKILNHRFKNRWATKYRWPSRLGP